jgi:hypothetical protein
MMDNLGHSLTCLSTIIRNSFSHTLALCLGLNLHTAQFSTMGCNPEVKQVSFGWVIYPSRVIATAGI